MRFNFNPFGSEQRPPLFLFGDPHGHFESVIQAVLRHRPIAIVLLGDLTSTRPLHIELAEIIETTEIWWIHGNHDADTDVYLDNISTHLAGSRLAGRNLHGRVANIAGLRVAGLGGVFRGSLWYPRGDASATAAFGSPAALRSHMKRSERWRDGISLRHRASIFPSDVRTLSQRQVDVLATHEAPSWHQHGFAAIDALAIRMQARWLVHGHQHEDIDYQVSHHRLRKPTGCTVMAYGVDRGSFIALPQ